MSTGWQCGTGSLAGIGFAPGGRLHQDLAQIAGSAGTDPLTTARRANEMAQAQRMPVDVQHVSRAAAELRQATENPSKSAAPAEKALATANPSVYNTGGVEKPAAGPERREGGAVVKPNKIVPAEAAKLESQYVSPHGEPKLKKDLGEESEANLRAAVDWHVARLNATNGKLMAADANIASRFALDKLGLEMRRRVLIGRGYSKEQAADLASRRVGNEDLPAPEGK